MCFSSDTSKYAFYEISDLCIWVGGYNDKPDGNGGGENAGPSDGNGEGEKPKRTMGRIRMRRL